MTTLLLHPKTADRLNTLSERPPHGLLLTGEAGSGKRTVARQISATILGLDPTKLDQYPYLHILDPADESIKIEAIRELQQFLKLKVPDDAGKTINRIVIIVRAERMRGEAQNALLKTLEEPPAGTCLILTAESSEQLLTTIVSRCQELPILPVGEEQAAEYFREKDIPAAKLRSAYALSMGQAGLLNALLGDEAHPLKEQVDIAKAILSEPAGKRLLRVDSLSKDKPSIRLLLGALRRIAHAAISASSRQGSPALKDWHRRQAAILQAQEDLRYNANTKLLLDNLLLEL